MATYGSDSWGQLTPNQQAQILAFLPLLRANAVLVSQMLDRMANMNTMWANVIGAEVELLAEGTVIPDSTGLAGALQLTTDQVQAYMVIVGQALSFWQTIANETLLLAAVGPANT